MTITALYMVWQTEKPVLTTNIIRNSGCS